MESSRIKIACIGCGYFARFHIEAWQRIPEIELVAICDLDRAKAIELAQQYNVPNVYSDVSELYAQEAIQVIDIITPPDTHYELCLQAAQLGIHIICQKPLAPTLDLAKKMVADIAHHKVRFMVHENWRFKPWYREIKKQLSEHVIGDKIHSIYFQMRMGDGWAEDAYLDRQPYFRTMPRLLVYETGIHFIDTFRYLVGEVESVFANLKKLNPKIAGEDAGHILFNFENGATGVWDANRFNESKSDNARYTFGEMLIDGNGGCLRLYNDGRITVQQLGEKERSIEYAHEDINFAGDCVYFLQKHFVHCFMNDLPFENSGEAYIKNLEIQEAVYASAKERKLITIENNF